MNATVTWEGVDALIRKIDATPERTRKATASSLYRAAEAIMADSKEHYVPVDVGVLRDSGFVTLPEEVSGGIQVTLGFGGAAQDYAVVQHEDLSLQHPHGGGPKYLERPLLDHGQRLLQTLAEDIRSELGGAS